MRKNLKIKVLGVGGAGCNAITRMKNWGIKGVDLIAINTDAQDLKKTKADLKLRIGRKLTQGLGAGMNPELGKRAAQEQREEIKEILEGADMIFITAGFGGGTGTGASPVIAEISKEIKALTVGVFTKPFGFEGFFRKRIAEEGFEDLDGKVDALIPISNDKLIKVLKPEISLSSAFKFCDGILRQAVQGISDLILLPGIINIDFADVKSIIKNSGTAVFGIGKADREKRAQKAAFKAINSPLLDRPCKGAKGVLFSVSGGKDISLHEINEIAEVITKELDPRAKVIFGAIQDEKFKKGQIKVTVIATGF